MPIKPPNPLNLFGNCRRLGVPLWQCPAFLFLLMGLFIIVSILTTYFIGTRYITDPLTVLLIVLGVTAVLFILEFIITHSFERLAEASRMKSEFINVVSHQLRSPITNLKWALELLTSKQVQIAEEKKEEYFTNFQENVDRMSELVDDLLIVSRIEEGALPIRKKPVLLQEIIATLAHRYKFFAEASHVQIDVTAADPLPAVLADPSQIKLAIENLIDNALRYTKGGGTVQVGAKRERNYVIVSVKDSGVGIPKEDQKFIFQKFFRSENVLREQTRGSGLGLFIARAIVMRAGGRIWFESEEGKGTTFFVRLPIT